MISSFSLTYNLRFLRRFYHRFQTIMSAIGLVPEPNKTELFSFLPFTRIYIPKTNTKDKKQKQKTKDKKHITYYKKRFKK